MKLLNTLISIITTLIALVIIIGCGKDDLNDFTVAPQSSPTIVIVTTPVPTPVIIKPTPSPSPSVKPSPIPKPRGKHGKQ